MDFIQNAFAEATLPERPIGPAGEDWYVLDQAGVLSDETEGTLQVQLSTLAADTSTGMVVVTILTLNDYPIESYALELGREWGVGQEAFDNGLVFLVVTEDREVRIEVGYGLEGAITDLQSSLILNKITSPYFKEGDYDQGVLKTVAELETLARGEPFATDDLQVTNDTGYSDVVSVLLFWALPIIWALFSWFSSTKAWWMGGIFGGFFGLMVGSWLGLAIGGTVGLFLDYVLSTYLFAKIRRPHGIWFRGGGGRGGSGGGGFSGFGGGGFGGGGASGRW
ncbi:MAG: TPM domain-containing protein [Candidatus Gracilibacteria bacterium]